MGSLGIEENKAGKMGNLLGDLPSQHLEPLWLKMDAMVPPTPNPIAKPHIWKYSETLPPLLKAGKLVAAEEAERRVLMLVNPAMESPYTTDTIYGGLQLVNPGETAPAHRHIAYACRFIIEGEGFTAVEGKKMPLKRGDVVVTPTWHWHDHGNESSAPVIWLDALNLPLFRFTPVHFAEQYSDSRYPSKLAEECEWRFPWAPVQRDLKNISAPHAVYHYRTQKGQPLSTTLGVQAERIDPGHTTEVSQESASYLYHCYEGKGRSVIDPPSGERVIVEWESKDTFAVPAWSKIKHINEGSEEAYLVAVSDQPLLERLGLLRPRA